MTTNAAVTIYNRYYDENSRTDRYQRTVIRGVWFYVDNKVQITDTGVHGADIYKVRIPAGADTSGAEYIPMAQYQGQEGTWTLQPDDYVCRGIIEDDIERPSELKKERNQVFKITSWSDNRFGGLPHWRIGGV